MENNTNQKQKITLADEERGTPSVLSLVDDEALAENDEWPIPLSTQNETVHKPDKPETEIEEDKTEAVLTELAKCSPIDYERRRELEAEKLGIRVSTLDKEVDLRRPHKDVAVVQGRALELFEPEPWPEVVDGSLLLDEIVTALKRFLILPKYGPEAIALWSVHAHAHDAADIAPRLAFTSPEKRCGKTTALSILGRLVPRALPASNITPAAVFRVIEAARPTLLIDEADTFLGNSDELRGVLNSGHSRESANVIRIVGDTNEPRTFSTWAAIAIAIIGRLPATLVDRSIEIPMKRRGLGENVEKLRRGQLNDLSDLSRKAARWTADNLEILKNDDPREIVGLHDRATDNWSPLLSIAALAGRDWSERAHNAALALSGSGEDQSYRVELLSDIHAIFEINGTDCLPSATICEALAEREDRPWPEWRAGRPITTQQLASLLKPFGIAPGTKRDSMTTFKGYRLEDFKDAFSRYTPLTEASRGNKPCNTRPNHNFDPSQTVKM